jgi:hypothetical protein
MSRNDYDVGYGKPPQSGKFAQGHTRSRGRRSRKAPDVHAVILDEIASTIEIKEGARTRKVTKLAALIKRLMVKALSGDLRALGMFLPLILAAGGDKALTQATENLSEIEKEMLLRNSASLLAALAAKAKKGS